MLVWKTALTVTSLKKISLSLPPSIPYLFPSLPSFFSFYFFLSGFPDRVSLRSSDCSGVGTISEVSVVTSSSEILSFLDASSRHLNFLPPTSSWPAPSLSTVLAQCPVRWKPQYTHLWPCIDDATGWGDGWTTFANALVSEWVNVLVSQLFPGKAESQNLNLQKYLWMF